MMAVTWVASSSLLGRHTWGIPGQCFQRETKSANTCRALIVPHSLLVFAAPQSVQTRRMWAKTRKSPSEEAGGGGGSKRRRCCVLTASSVLRSHRKTRCPGEPAKASWWGPRPYRVCGVAGKGRKGPVKADRSWPVGERGGKPLWLRCGVRGRKSGLQGSRRRPF